MTSSVTKAVFILCLIALSALSSQLALAQENTRTNLIPVTFHLQDADISASADTGSINFYFNPKEISITKRVPWKHERGDAPSIEFTSGEPYRLTVELLFDGYEEKRDVSRDIERLAIVTEDKKRPPQYRFTWGGFEYKGRIEDASVRYTLFLDDGTPVRAVVNANFSRFLPAADERRGSPAHLDFHELLDASEESFRLLRAYDAESLSEVVEGFFSNVQPEFRRYELSPLVQPSDASDASTSDEMQITRGFRVEISGLEGGKSEDNAWEACTGGALNIEVADASVGSDQFHTSTPGHKYVDEIQLRGPMTSSRKAIIDWLSQNNRPCRSCKNASLSFYDASNRTTLKLDVPVLDAFYFRNEVLLFHLNEDRLHATLLNVKRTYSDGSQCNGPPRIFILLPSSGGPSFMPVGVVGANFDNGAVPFFTGHPSISLYNLNTQNLPLIGPVSVGVTLVPPAAPSGAGDITVEYLGQRSNPFPFSKN